MALRQCEREDARWGHAPKPLKACRIQDSTERLEVMVNQAWDGDQGVVAFHQAQRGQRGELGGLAL